MHIFSERNRLIRSFAVLLLGILSIGATPAEPALDPISRESVIREINRHRAESGLPPLRSDDRLHAAAEDRIVDMETVGYWGHHCPEGHSPFVWLADHLYTHQIAGENLAAGYETTEVLVQSWMESPGHRANILSPGFADIGVALIDGGTTRRMNGRSVVVLFATEMAPEDQRTTEARNDKRQ